MPSPFPGMDPYLEDRDIYPDFHDRFVTYLAEVAQPALPDPYLSGIGQRAWIEVSERYVEPDVEVFRSPRQAVVESGGGTSVSTHTASEPIVIHVPHDEHREPFVEIYIGRRNDRRLVTVIELLSRTNKSPGEHGRDLYVRKQREVLDSKVKLVEIDLLRAGLHTTAVPELRLRRKVPRFDYHVCIHRFDNLEDFFVHPVQLEEPLPTIQVPLLPEDGSVAINLQAVFDRCYDAGPYSREIDYQQDQPDPPFTADQSTWFRELMKQEHA
jgi:hypothetical protein